MSHIFKGCEKLQATPGMRKTLLAAVFPIVDTSV
jgi:hypothetical protein